MWKMDFHCLGIFHFAENLKHKAVTGDVMLVIWCIFQLTSGHRTVILSAMERIIKQKMDEIDNELMLDTIRRASAELTQSKVTVFCCDILYI